MQGKWGNQTGFQYFQPYFLTIPYLIEFITEIMTLEVGDVITTGTPPGVGEMQRGDTVEVEIKGIGILRNEVV